MRDESKRLTGAGAIRTQKNLKHPRFAAGDRVALKDRHVYGTVESCINASHPSDVRRQGFRYEVWTRLGVISTLEANLTGNGGKQIAALRGVRTSPHKRIAKMPAIESGISNRSYPTSQDLERFQDDLRKSIQDLLALPPGSLIGDLNPAGRCLVVGNLLAVEDSIRHPTSSSPSGASAVGSS